MHRSGRTLGHGESDGNGGYLRTAALPCGDHPHPRTSTVPYVGVVVDGFSFDKCAGNRPTVNCLQDLVMRIESRTSGRIHVGAKRFFFPDPLDAVNRGLLRQSEVGRTVELLKNIKQQGWQQVKTSKFRLLDGVWQAYVDKPGLVNACANLCRRGSLPDPRSLASNAASAGTVTLQHLVLVTGEVDDMRWFMSNQETVEELRWVVPIPPSMGSALDVSEVVRGRGRLIDFFNNPQRIPHQTANPAGAAVPSSRSSASTVVRAACAIAAQLLPPSSIDADSDAAAAPRARLVACLICADEEVPVEESFSCSNGHCVCHTCFSRYIVETWAERCAINASGPAPTLCCAVPECSATPIVATMVAKHATAEAFELFLAKRDQYRDAVTLSKVNAILEKVKADTNLLERTRHEFLQEQLQKEFPNARMCPKCQCGPIDHYSCPDLASHHGERVGAESRVDNSCPRCRFFAASVSEWRRWDGVLRPDRCANSQQRVDNGVGSPRHPVQHQPHGRRNYYVAERVQQQQQQQQQQVRHLLQTSRQTYQHGGHRLGGGPRQHYRDPRAASDPSGGSSKCRRRLRLQDAHLSPLLRRGPRSRCVWRPRSLDASRRILHRPPTVRFHKRKSH